VAFSNDDELLLVCCSNTLKLLALATAEEASHISFAAMPAPLSAQEVQGKPPTLRNPRFLGDVTAGSQERSAAAAAAAAGGGGGGHAVMTTPTKGIGPVASPCTPATPWTPATPATPSTPSKALGMMAKQADASCMRCLYKKTALGDTGMAVPLAAHVGQVLQAVFHPHDVELVVSCGEDSAVKVWWVTRRLTRGEVQARADAESEPTSRRHVALSERLVRKFDAAARCVQACALRAVQHRGMVRSGEEAARQRKEEELARKQGKQQDT
jgi:hypothetical protein